MGKKFAHGLLILLMVLALVALPLLAGCAVEEEEEEEEEALPALGYIEVRVTDPPPPGVKSAMIQAENIEVHRADAEGEGEWEMLIKEPPIFDLVEIFEDPEVLGSVEIEVGSFTQIRMDVTEVTVVTDEDVEITATVPSEKLKIVRPFSVAEGVTTVLTLDFDGDKCIVFTGEEKVIFKPVVKLLVSEVPGALEITTTSLPDGKVETAYTATVEATGGTEPYTWSVSAGDLPDGLTLDSATGVISGTPTTKGDYSFTVQVEDSSDPVQSDTQDLNIDIEKEE